MGCRGHFLHGGRSLPSHYVTNDLSQFVAEPAPEFVRLPDRLKDGGVRRKRPLALESGSNLMKLL